METKPIYTCSHYGTMNNRICCEIALQPFLLGSSSYASIPRECAASLSHSGLRENDLSISESSLVLIKLTPVVKFGHVRTIRKYCYQNQSAQGDQTMKSAQFDEADIGTAVGAIVCIRRSDSRYYFALSKI
jgi:hypothetical protein